ncbi:Coiled-coil domain-containing protein 126 [Collichthys lucidus]|uniref:Coiled-coil domain-containing protein 126 n=1 Tax=Collichthys lucidus TaxID=240159 RepID=A0A4U5VJL2_COLLU|nr:Coiled-coil domain-containing protein 126 [Collichthys lucidus]
MLGTLLRRNMSQKLSVLLLVFGLAWGLMLLRYTVQQPRHQSSAELREQILELSRRYVKVLTEENQNAPGGPQGTSMAGYADLKRTIAVLLDDILTRLVKLEGKIDLVVNASSTNTSHTAEGHITLFQRLSLIDTTGHDVRLLQHINIPPTSRAIF